MRHIRPVSRASIIPIGQDGTGSYTILESVILLLVGVYFRDWDNFTSVYQNLQKFYRKT